MNFTDFLQGVVMIGLYTWPIWVFGIVIVILDCMQEKQNRQRGKL